MTKKIISVLFICALLFAIYQIKETYSLFETKVTDVNSMDIAVWNININNNNVTETVTNTFPLNGINWTESSHVLEGNVAPGIDGYFDIIMNPINTEVSVRYDITYDMSNFLNDEFKVTSIVEINNKNFIRTGEFTYTGIILLEDIVENDTHTVRTTITWNNDDNNSSDDSIIGMIPNNTISIPVIVNISQYLGENIVPYVEE